MAIAPVTQTFRSAAQSAVSKIRHAAFVGATAITVGLAALSPSSAQTINVNNVQPVPPAATQTLPAITKEQCNRIFDFTTMALEENGKDFISPQTRAGFKNFFMPVKGVIDCAGPRELPWVTKQDFHFIIAIGDKATDALKVDVRAQLGVKPSERPTASLTTTGQRSELATARPGS
jgi:hypothetical protein